MSATTPHQSSTLTHLQSQTETFILGDRKISLRTSLLEEKATACSMICCYADELKEGFLPYVQQVTGIMVPLLKFYFNEEVRTAAVQSLPELLRCATAARDAGKGVDDAFVRSMLEFMWTPLLDAMAKVTGCVGGVGGGGGVGGA